MVTLSPATKREVGRILNKVFDGMGVTHYTKRGMKRGDGVEAFGFRRVGNLHDLIAVQEYSTEIRLALREYGIILLTAEGYHGPTGRWDFYLALDPVHWE